MRSLKDKHWKLENEILRGGFPEQVKMRLTYLRGIPSLRSAAFSIVRRNSAAGYRRAAINVRCKTKGDQIATSLRGRRPWQSGSRGALSPAYAGTSPLRWGIFRAGGLKGGRRNAAPTKKDARNGGPAECPTGLRPPPHCDGKAFGGRAAHRRPYEKDARNGIPGGSAGHRPLTPTPHSSLLTPNSSLHSQLSTLHS